MMETDVGGWGAERWMRIWGDQGCWDAEQGSFPEQQEETAGGMEGKLGKSPP